MQITPHHPDDLEQLRQRSQQERDAKQRDRYRAVVLALEGHSAPQIARTLARSRRFVQLWVYAYRDHGREAIVPKRQSGCPSKLPAAQEPSFQQRLLAGPPEADGVCTLRAKDIRRLLQQEFGVEYSLPGVYDLLHPIPPRCSNGSNKPPFCPENGPGTSRPAARGLVPGRSPDRPTGNPDPLLGSDRLAADGAPADRV